MTSENQPAPGADATTAGGIVSLLSWLIALVAVLVIPFKVMSLGYLPPDDALRHAAQAVSGKPWSEILVLGEAFKMNHNFGWDAALRGIHLATGCGAEALVIFSVIALFSLMGWSVLPWLRRPEAWLGALLLMTIGAGLIGRLMLGRPFMISIAALVGVLGLWQSRGDSAPGRRDFAVMAGLVAASVYFHGAWYFWALPLMAFFLARQFLWGFVLAVAFTVGALLAAILTGHPVDYLTQALTLAFKSLGYHATQRTMVGEYQPLSGDIFALLIAGFLLTLRSLAKLNLRPLATSPVFWLVCLGWVLQFKAARFWLDWGWPALMVWIAFDLQAWMEQRLAKNSLQRLIVATALALALFLAVTNDIGSRWTNRLSVQYLTPDQPELAGWLPEKGGVLYAADMGFFYETFFKNPNAPWRYALGFEPILMTADNFATYHRILWNKGEASAFQPWADKLTRPDRIVLSTDGGIRPDLPQLEWKHAFGNTWIGRLPPAAATP